MGKTTDLTQFKDRAARLMANGDWGGALKYLKKAQPLAPKDTHVALKIGDMYQRLGEKQKAILAYKQAATLFAAAGFLVKAISVNKVILSLDPQDKEVQTSLAALYSKKDVTVATDQNSPALLPASAGVPPPAPEVPLVVDLARVDRQKLPRTPLFSELSESELNRVIDKLIPVSAAQGTVICVEGEAAQSLYVISHGLVRVSCRDAQGTPLWLTNLSDGDFFGEFGFFCDGKRHADVVAVEDTELLQIDRKDIESIAEEFPRVNDALFLFYKERVLDTLLAKSQMFKSLKAEERKQIVDQSGQQQVADGAQIIREGVTGEALYMIRSGTVEVFTEMNDRRIDLARLGPGDVFGELSVLTGTLTTANVVARGPAELIVFLKMQVVEMANLHPQLYHFLSALKEHRIHETVQRIQLEGFV